MRLIHGCLRYCNHLLQTWFLYAVNSNKHNLIPRVIVPLVSSRERETLVESKKKAIFDWLLKNGFISCHFQILNSKIVISFGFFSISSWRWSRNKLFYNLPVPQRFCFCKYSNYCYLRDTRYWNLFWLIKCISLVSYFSQFKRLECIRRCIYTRVYCLASEK